MFPLYFLIFRLWLAPLHRQTYFYRGAGMAQWWEHSPPTSVARVRLPIRVSYVGWVCYWFSSLLREVFLRELRLSPLLKNQHFQISIRSRAHENVLTSFWDPKCFVSKQITFTFTFFFHPFRIFSWSTVDKGQNLAKIFYQSALSITPLYGLLREQIGIPIPIID